MNNVDLDTLRIINNREKKRYEVDLGDATALIDYIPSSKLIVFTHTEVPEQYKGLGIAQKMIRHVLDEARANNMQVRPICPMVRVYLRRHPEYMDLVPERYRP